MKSGVILATGLVFVCSIGTMVLSDELTNKVDQNEEVRRLRDEVNGLRRQVDFLMTERGYGENAVDALTQRIRQVEEVQSRIRPVFHDGGQVRGGEEQLNRCDAELRLARARLAFAQKDYSSAMEHMDAAIAAWTKMQEILEDRKEIGMVTLDLLMAAQQSTIDAILEKRSMRRTFQFLQAERP